MKRTEIYTGFGESFVKSKDDRTMDEICFSSDDGFQLQAQQKFLKKFITKYDDSWDKLLLYHQIGSGKTCSAITIAEQYTELHPTTKVTVILPARLRTNFFDELVSPCGMDKYISTEDFQRYHSNLTSDSEKAKIKRIFMKKIGQKYDLLSFEKFRIDASKYSNLQNWVKAITTNKLIIIDEVHNLISTSYDAKQYKRIIQDHALEKRTSGINTVLFKYLTTFADPSCKMVFMTATPVFDSLPQLRELVLALNPNSVFVDKAKRETISTIVENLRGKVSFFPGTSPNAYPGVEYIMHEVPLSKLQDKQMVAINEKNSDLDESKEAFLIQQRQIAIAVGNKSVSEIIENTNEFAPKIKKVVDKITSLKGKHVVYCTFIKSGLDLVQAELKKRNWVNYIDVKDDDLEKYAGRIYAQWDGSTSDEHKTLIKRVVNNVDNIKGNIIRVILGSPSIKEGVSFKHVQHLHILDPVWNSSAKAQVEGRAIRFCSHIDVPKDHKYLKRSVTVHLYKAIPRANGGMRVTADQQIYEFIIPRKKEAIDAAEQALQKVSIDYYLFRAMYRDKLSPIPKDRIEKSPLNLDKAFDKPVYAKKKPSVKSSCPKKRRPDPLTEECPPGLKARENKHGVMCCYKKI